MKTIDVEKQANLIGGAVKSRFKVSGGKKIAAWRRRR